jgi:hypothetical protein
MTTRKKKVFLKEEFINFLLRYRVDIEKFVLDNFKKPIFNIEEDNPLYTEHEKRLIYEAKIFSLWLITLCLHQKSNEFKDLLHDTFSDQADLNKAEKKIFYQDIEKRYKIYFEAYNQWAEKIDVGNLFGTTIVEVIINHNVDFSPKELPLIGDAFKSTQAFIIFGELFKEAIRVIGEAEKEFLIEDSNK